MSLNNEIIYPCFLLCREFASNAYWKIIFEDLAYGKCPTGTYISKEFFCCSYKGKEFSYKIEKKEPEILYNEIYNLLYVKLGMNSNQDKQKKRNRILVIESDIIESRKDWSMIRKKNVKDLLIEQYIISMSSKHSLCREKTKHLYSMIYIALSFKLITSKDIEFSNGEITNIKGVEFKNNDIIFTKSFKSDDQQQDDNQCEQKLMSDNWQKFLKNFM